MQFHKQLNSLIKTNNSLLCVGLDTDIEEDQFEFNKKIIDQTHDLVCAYKPNPAFYESHGLAGLRSLIATCDYLKATYRHIPIIIDAKRGDIGNTNKQYATYAFSYLGGDAITVMPYMGIESLKPFFAYKEKGIIVGCHSSNKGSEEFQDLIVGNVAVYEQVALNLIKQQGRNPNAMIFMGATYPDQLKRIREFVDDMTILVPGVGAQGASIQEVVEAGLNSKGTGLIINASRSIIFADDPRAAALQLRNEINMYRLSPDNK